MMPQFLIWSNEHRAWWRADHAGYTTDHRQAGRYSFDEATTICLNASYGSGKTPNETMLPEGCEPKFIS